MSEKRIRIRRGGEQVDTPTPEEAPDNAVTQAEVPTLSPSDEYARTMSDYRREMRGGRADDTSRTIAFQEVLIEYDMRGRIYTVRIPMLYVRLSRELIEQRFQYGRENVRDMMYEEIMRRVGAYVRDSLQRIQLP